MDKAFLREYIMTHLSEKRAIHSINVAKEAVKLAEKYGADVEKAEIAGILHDIAKETPVEEQLQILNKSGIIKNTADIASPKLLHAQTATVLLPELFCITDADIITAIRFHTTAREGMSLLEKVLYVADYISEDRIYDGVEELRKVAYESLEEAMLIGLQFTIAELAEGLRPIHPDTVNAYNQIVCEKNSSIK